MTARLAILAAGLMLASTGCSGERASSSAGRNATAKSAVGETAATRAKAALRLDTERSIRATAAASAAPQDAAVGAKIREYLNLTFALPGRLSVSLRIQRALAEATAARERPGKSTDPVLRDAEYYLHGLYATSARDWDHISATLTAPAYSAVKWVALRCRELGWPELERALRTNPSNPISDPGGSMWAFRGLADGYTLDGARVVPPQPGHGLSLPHLERIAPCTPR